MKPSEKLIYEYLQHLGYANIVYEPDGNTTPDFLVDGTIAIEVRRLNQNHFDGSGAKGLEEDAISLWLRIKKLVTSLGFPTEGESWYVWYQFKRPVVSWKILKPKLLQALQAFIDSPVKQRGTIVNMPGFNLRVFKTGRPYVTMFVMGGNSDQDSGGWLIRVMEENINHCVSEKSRKIEKVRSKYGQWWLALVDHIGYGLDDFDREQFRNQVSIEHDWDKIIIIDPRNHARWFEI
jgi:hypothetical protein